MPTGRPVDTVRIGQFDQDGLERKADSPEQRERHPEAGASIAGRDHARGGLIVCPAAVARGEPMRMPPPSCHARQQVTNEVRHDAANRSSGNSSGPCVVKIAFDYATSKAQASSHGTTLPTRQHNKDPASPCPKRRSLPGKMPMN